MPTLSVAIITLNEERNLPDCLAGVRWADEIVVVDSGSTDRTVEIARAAGARVEQRPWPGINAQRTHTLGLCTGEWVLSLDADERVPPALADEIRAALGSDNGSVAGYTMNRHAFYLGRWINHGGWYPDRKLRLFRRALGRYVGQDPHDEIAVEGPVHALCGELHHFTYRSFADQIRQINTFSDVIADRYVREGGRSSLTRMLLHPPAKFLECWLWKSGWRDGLPGFAIAVATAFYAFARQVKIWERTRPR
ncbi:MAG: glycosyltransferase family 2 protein [Planctomycetes bacterium]|nr:glycosyltransferase family 2 protein [Planctomycetota bacterium]